MRPVNTPELLQTFASHATVGNSAERAHHRARRRVLQCVYEIATFCRDRKDTLDEDLILLSLTWPSVFNPFKSSKLTRDELAHLKGFSVRHASAFKPA